MKKSTDELLEILKKDDVNTFLKDNDEELLKGSLSRYLKELMFEKGLTIPEIARKADIYNIYVYQIFDGTKNPSRDKLIALCFGMGLTFEESQTLLKYAGVAVLYPRNKRDSVIISALNNGQSINECNHTLDGLELETL